MYDCVRWFTITGKHITFTPTTIEERPQQLITLHTHHTTRKPYNPQPTQQTKINIQPSQYSNYVTTAIKSVCADIQTVAQGSKHHTFNYVICPSC